MGWSCVAGIKRWHLRGRPGWGCFRRKPCAATMTATPLGAVSLLEGSLGSCCHLLIRVLRAKALYPLLVRTTMASRCHSPPWGRCFLEPRNLPLVARCLGRQRLLGGWNARWWRWKWSVAATGALVILVLLVDLSWGLLATVMSRCSVPFDGA